MRRYFRILEKQWYLPLVLLVTMPALTFSQGFSSYTTTRLQHVIDSFQNNPANPFVGGIAAAIKVDGLAYWQGVTGHAARNVDAGNNLLPGGIPFTSSTISRMYSVTKTFTAALVLELVKEGKFGLDDPVSNFIPFLPALNPELNGSVTIGQLLSHESGYSNYSDEQMLQIAVAFQPTHQWTVYEMLTFVHQVNAPGAVRKYSNTNYLVLGAIIETATGTPLQQHFRERFFLPLKLNSMYLDAREPQWPGSLLASPHDNISPFNPIFTLTGQPTFPDAWTNISAFPFTAISTLEFSSGGIITNIADMAEWGNALFSGRATNPSTLNEMIQSISPTPDEDGDYLGYGIFRTTRISASDIFIGHDGNAPGYRSLLFYQPERKMTISILTNYRGARLYEVAKALYEVLPAFICGNENRKEAKIVVSFNGNKLCVNRNAAATLIEKGAYLDNFEQLSTNQVIVRGNSGQEHTGRVNDLILSPNPATNEVSVSFLTKVSGKVSLELYDMNGKLIRNVFAREMEKGVSQRLSVQTANVPSGIYLFLLRTPGTINSQKLIIDK